MLQKICIFFSTIDNFYIFVFANGDKMCLKTASKADKWLRLNLLPLSCADMAEVPIFTQKNRALIFLVRKDLRGLEMLNRK